MDITNSPDISSLLVKVNWDISGSLPQIILTNLSTGGNLAGCTWAFTAASPSQTPIHAGNINQPDITGNWSTHTLSDAWPRPFNSIEFSGAPYSFFVVVKDSIGNVYTNNVQYTNICRPVGNTQSSKNSFGVASSDVKVQCQQASVFFQDTTYHTYQGVSGTQYSSVLRVIYPIDETLVIPEPGVFAAYTTALVPITYSSKNYQFVQTVIYDYDLGDNTLVRVRYQTMQTFGVYCNIDLLPLVCEINKLLDEVESGNCADINEAQRKMNLVVGKFTLVMIGIEQPLTGVDVPALIDEIVAIGGFDCNCCTAPSGIIPTTSSVIGGYNFLVNKLGGDVNGSWSTNGNNITLNLSDVSYVVAIGNQSPSSISAFSVTPVVSSNGFLKTYYINIDGIQLANDILNIIKGNTALITLFNSIVNIGAGDFQLIVDGDCIFSNSNVCDYIFGLINIPADTISGDCLLTGISAGGETTSLAFSFDLNSLPALQAYLNTLGLGTCSVVDLGSGNIRITFAANSHNLQQITYKTSVTNAIATFSSNCTGFTPLSANEVVQAIIYYICNLNDSQLKTSQDYVICSIDPVSKLKVLTTVTKGTVENQFIATLLDKNCDTVDFTLGLKELNCVTLKQQFPYNANVLQLSDFIFGTKGGSCAGINPVELGTRILQLGVYNADFMAAFCAAVELCAGGKSCEPYTIYQLSVIQGSPASTMSIVVTFTHPSAISDTIRYARIDNTNNPVYTTIPNVLPGASPYVISNVPDGQYIVGITPNYSDGRKCGEVFLNTDPCSGITGFSGLFNGSGNIVISYTADPAMESIKIVINYPNGGTASSIHTNTGVDITITPPAGVYGEFAITGIPVCRASTGFFGQPTAPVILNVTPANQSSFTNNTSNTLAPVSMSAKSATVGLITPLFTSTSVAISGIVNFYIPDDLYGVISITWGTGTIGGAYLTTTSGVYIATIIGNQATFADVDVANGITVQVTDVSPAP